MLYHPSSSLTVSRWLCGRFRRGGNFRGGGGGGGGGRHRSGGSSCVCVCVCVRVTMAAINNDKGRKQTQMGVQKQHKTQNLNNRCEHTSTSTLHTHHPLTPPTHTTVSVSMQTQELQTWLFHSPLTSTTVFFTLVPEIAMQV